MIESNLASVQTRQSPECESEYSQLLQSNSNHNANDTSCIKI